MRIRLLFIATCAIVLLFAACKKEENGATGSIIEATEVLDKAEEKFAELGAANALTPQQALMETAAWLEGQDGVASLYTIDSMIIMMETDGGLQLQYQYMPVDANGRSLFRGGGGGGVSFKQFASGSCSDPIDNDKVLLLAPSEAEFYGAGELDALAARIGSTSKNLQVTVLRDVQCSPAIMKQFGNYGLVILDTHGVPDGFLTGSYITFLKTNKPADEQAFKDAINTQVGSDAVAKINSGEYRLSALTFIKEGKVNWWPATVEPNVKYNIYVTSKFIKTMPKLTNTVLLANMCYSGYNNNTYESKGIEPIRPAFLSLDPLSYYCYAMSNGTANAVSNIFATKMENALVGRLVIDIDSTMIAHLKADNVTEYLDSIPPSYKIPLNNFKHFGKDTYCYTCGGTLVDTRDNKRYKTVCIGNQVWMAEDLKYNAPGSYCYDNNTANCNSYGRLYSWTTSMNGDSASSSVPSGVRGICPTGWHIPSKAEWDVLVTYLGGINVAGGALRETTGWDAPNVGATNSANFDAKPTGYYNTTIFSSLGSQVSWWTSTYNTFTPGYYYYVTTGSYYASISTIYSAEPNSLYTSCRCVKD